MMVNCNEVVYKVLLVFLQIDMLFVDGIGKFFIV